ncbi:phenylacetate--CoA ligase family protein [Actinophytocola sp.]|jgi:phenylacetate-CoA ligase|uniref:phenylacetate--CoA ligase family protein n=1 Tax=Actinophytocola sp. TaxID=1872138 RepID=UPI002E198DC2
MYTIFHPEQDALVRDLLAKHTDFERGAWTAERLHDHQRAELRATLSFVVGNAPFYRSHLRQLTSADIDAFELSDLSRLPFTTKDDLRDNLLDLLSRPVTDGWVFYETTGTTGRATPCPRDNTDSGTNNMALTVNYRDVLRAHPGRHLIAVMGPTELHSTGDTFGDVFRNLGHPVAKMWPHSPVVGFRRALELLGDLHVTGLVCTPAMAMSLAKQARDLGLSARDDFDLNFIMVVGELATPALLANIESLWSATAYNCMYASQESSILAAVRADGRLRTIPLSVVYEVIDPDSGNLAEPRADGSMLGELVITHLYRGCKPLIRYRTGDLVRLTPPAGAADYPSHTLQPLGRVRDTVLVDREPISAFDLEQTVLTHVRRCVGYQIVIDGEDGTDRLTVRLECLDPDAVDEPALRAEVRRRFGVEPVVSLEDIGGIAGTGALVSWKASRVHDRRVPDDVERRAALAIAGRRDAR